MERAELAALPRRASRPSPAARSTRRTAIPHGDGPLRAALREAEEETGLDPAGVQLFGVLPQLYIPVERLRGHPGAGLVA